MNSFPEGSQWRKWDLHVHSPQSYGGDYDKFIQNAVKSEAEVIGINDYCSIKGYKLITEQGGIKGKILFPVVEFRMHNIVANRKSQTATKAGTRINFHIIFDNREEIFSKIETWINSLECYNATGTTDQLGNIKNEDLNKVTFDFETIINSLKKFSLNNYSLIWLPYDEYGGIDDVDPEDNFFKLSLINKADIIGSSSSKQIDFFKWKDQSHSLVQYETWFSKPKPCIKGSDCHQDDYPIGKLQDSTSSPTDRYCWIKADPTFDGLKQIVVEPDRVYIGELPTILKRVAQNTTKYIDSIQIKKIPGSTITDTWFDNFNLKLNHELVAIIGNKGKGKSALSDIIGLCGNTHNFNEFSFLHKDKFRKAQPSNLAKEFQATITWNSTHTDSKILNDNSDVNAHEKVKYIPQSFLEKLCTSIDKRIFEDELEKVIFSRLDESKKLGKGSLKEIINEKKQALDLRINQAKGTMIKKNSEIIELERKETDEYKKSIGEILQSKKSELEAHDSKKPADKIKPKETEETKQKTLEITEAIAKFRTEIKQHEQLIAEATSTRNTLAIEVNELDQLSKAVTALKDYVEKSISATLPLIDKYKLIKDDIISFKIQMNSVTTLKMEKEKKYKELDDLLSVANSTGPYNLIKQAEQGIKKLQDELEGDNKEYQKYLSELHEWEIKRTEIVGTESKDGTLNYYTSHLQYLQNNLGADLSRSYQERNVLLKELIQLKFDIAQVYKELYQPVSDFITANKNELSEYNVKVDVALEINEFSSKFFNYISNGKAGSFCGAEEGRIMLNQITEIINFNDADSVLKWINLLAEHLKFDKRDQQANAKRSIAKQLKTGYNEQNLYDFLFGFEYYEPSYQLKLGDRNLNELSPGERGALLLIFYLLLDKSDIPIIIDQPEENLDNQSVYNILVHFIKKAKERRQIIIVTHNPNLAVVCDAEQIIRMNISKSDKNKVAAISGAIESPEINKSILDILEGTRPAFSNRTDKYEISSRLTKKAYYFAYGSNMDQSRLTDRKILSAKFQCVGKMKDAKLTLDKTSNDGSGKANYKQETGQILWGVIYEVNAEELIKLDDFEKGYKRIQVEVSDPDGNTFYAETYHSDKINSTLKPKNEYLEYLRKGAKDFNLPTAYIDFLMKLEGND